MNKRGGGGGGRAIGLLTGAKANIACFYLHALPRKEEKAFLSATVRHRVTPKNVIHISRELAASFGQKLAS